MVILYTDGGCHGNPGPGGWAFCAVSQEDSREQVVHQRAGFDAATTNNRMELVAVIQGLLWIQDSPELLPSVQVVTDSQYVRQGITEWITKWERNGWLTAARKPVKNADLWRELLAAHRRVNPQWAWVRGHSGNTYNELCDQLVQKQILNRGQA